MEKQVSAFPGGPGEFRAIPAGSTARSDTIRLMLKEIALVVTVLMSLVGVFGDYFINLAGEDKHINWRYFIIGFVVYALTAFGWLFVMRHLKLATLGVIYTLTVTAALTLVGYLFFNEQLNRYELIGLAFAAISLILMGRFA